MVNVPVLVISVLIFVGSIVLQVFLSRREGRLPGLVLPLLTLLLSLVGVLNLMAPPDATAWQIAGMCAQAFLFYNIPTLILLAIYFGCRESRKRKRQMNKMNVQDLE